MQDPGLAVAGEDISIDADDGRDVGMPVGVGEFVLGIEDRDGAGFVAVARLVAALGGSERGGKASKRGLSSEQTPIVVARDRSGATTDAVLPRLDIASMTGALGHAITTGAVLCCDGGKAIRGFARRARIKTHVLDAPGNPKPDAPQFHINNVNAYHGRLKEWMRRFHGVATDNLPNYLSWRRTIEALSNARLFNARY
jgi:hypothetical protein